MKNNKGITLIALIITIIVMMILVAVTVAVVVNSDLIGTAKGAGADYKAKEEGERNIAGFNRIVDGEERYFNNVQEYIDFLNGNGGAEGDDTTGGDGIINVVDNPEYYLFLADVILGIDENTTWQNCIDASNGVITGEEKDNEDGEGWHWIALYVNGKGRRFSV